MNINGSLRSQVSRPNVAEAAKKALKAIQINKTKKHLGKPKIQH